MRGNTVSLFTGAGGMDFGFEAAGFRTRVAVEMDRDCCETIRRNLRIEPLEERLEDVSTEAILARGEMKLGEVDLLIGGPPCQPFSKSAYWSRGDTLRLEDPRARTLDAYMRCVAEMLPTVFVLENVHGISYSGKEEGLRLLCRLTEEINKSRGTKYRPRWSVINAAAFGVPQLRERFFLVAHRDGQEFQFPKQTHLLSDDVSPQPSLFGSDGLSPTVTAWDALGGMKLGEDEDLRPKGQWADLLPSIPEGENYLWHTSRKGGLPLFGWRSRYWSFLLKLAKAKPSWTIQAQPGPAIGPFHWENRYLSAAELAAIQTFPREVRVHGSRMSVQRQIGNAVPSLLTEVLGRAIAEQYFGRVYRAPLRLAVEVKGPPPPPEKLGRVPKKFRHLVGNHPDYDVLRREEQRRTARQEQPALE